VPFTRKYSSRNPDQDSRQKDERAAEHHLQQGGHKRGAGLVSSGNALYGTAIFGGTNDFGTVSAVLVASLKSGFRRDRASHPTLTG
jgi:hypothetical protein